MTEILKRFARRMKRQLRALYLAGRDPRTPFLAKCLVIVLVAYALSPIDLIPDFIPVLGYLDDLVLLPIGIYLAIKLMPHDLWQELQAQAEGSQFVFPQNRIAVPFILLIWFAVCTTFVYFLLPVIAR